MLRLIVGDKTFYCSQSNLQKSEYFTSLLARWNKEEDIIIDEDHHLFKHFLNCLRHANYKIPEKYNDNVCNLLNYYGVKINKIAYDDLMIFKLAYFCDMVRYKPIKDIVLKDNYTHYHHVNDNMIKFEFVGKLGDIIFEKHEKNIELEIIFNGKTLFNETLGLKMFCNKDLSLNKNLIYNIDNLEGKFTIKIKNFGDYSVITYFEKSE